MKYRSGTDIIAQILDAANGGSIRTKIMYKAFLSHAQLKEYCAELTENGLLAYDQTTQIFKTTESGLRFVKIYGEIGNLALTPQPLQRQR